MTVKELIEWLSNAESSSERVALRIHRDNVKMQGAENMRVEDTGTTFYIIAEDMPLTW